MQQRGKIGNLCKQHEINLFKTAYSWFHKHYSSNNIQKKGKQTNRRKEQISKRSVNAVEYTAFTQQVQILYDSSVCVCGKSLCNRTYIIKICFPTKFSGYSGAPNIACFHTNKYLKNFKKSKRVSLDFTEISFRDFWGPKIQNR